MSVDLQHHSISTVLLDRKIRLDLLEFRQTINSDRYIETLIKLKNRNSKFRKKKIAIFCLQHDNTWLNIKCFQYTGFVIHEFT